jgi:thiol-disulfide isomerase/thioredoxin
MTTYPPLRNFVTFLVLAPIAFAQTPATSDGPTNEKAQKTYAQAIEHAKKHQYQDALDGFKKADKQDDGHCIECQKKIAKYALELRDWKAAESAAAALIAEAKDARSLAFAHYRAGAIALLQGNDKHKDEDFARAHEHFTKAIESAPNFPDAVFGDGKALAHLHQDDAAKARFEQYTKMASVSEVERQRALRFISDPELARAKMAPPFSVTTADGQQLSLDDLQGKVVLMDFWATWCGPCREAMPHMRDIAKKFKGEPLIVLSVSLDDDERKWKDFIQKNEMTWPQYRDPAGFKGQMADLFAVRAIPHTFTIDADGVLQDEHIGDASVEGKLKKLIARAKEVQANSTTAKSTQ